MDDYKYLFKIVLIGNSGVGKTSLVRRFTEDCFPPGQCATIGVDFMIKTLCINKDVVKLQIWDTAGQERFKAITQSYYRSANALILVYDVTNQETFNSLPHWLNEIGQYARDNVPVFLVGNKSDAKSEREVATCIGEEFSKQNHISFIETSAKASENVGTLFEDIASKLREESILMGVPPLRHMTDSFTLKGSETTMESKYTCCWFL